MIFKPKAINLLALSTALLLFGCSSPDESKDNELKIVSNSSQNSFSSATMNSSVASDSSKASQISINYRPQGKFSADELFTSIPQNSDTSIQPNSVNDGWFFYQTIDPTICWLYPTKGLYGWDSKSEELYLISERNPESKERVWDFIVIDGDLYESRISQDDKGLMNKVFCNEELLLESYVTAPSQSLVFSVLNNKLYGTLERLSEESLVLDFIELNPNDYQIIWSKEQSLKQNTPLLLKSPYSQYGTQRIVFEYQDGSQLKLVFYDGSQILEVPTDIYAHQLIPLKSGTLICKLEISQKNMQYSASYCWYEAGSNEKVELKVMNPPNQPDGYGAEYKNSYLVSGGPDGVFRASIESGVLSFESISNIPAGKYNFYSLEGDDESLVILRNSVDENQHSYLEYSAYSIDENE